MALWLSAVAVAAPPFTPDISLGTPSYPLTFVAYGDIRFTRPSDTRHSNPAVRMALVKQIAENKPAFVIISGDIVLDGSNPDDWREYQKETQAWRDAGVRTLLALGNHDVHGNAATALGNYFGNFSELHSRRWYSVQDGNVVLFVYDSTSNDGPGTEQWKWLQSSLSSLPKTVDFVILALHHPPYTQSSEHLVGGGHSARKPEQELGRMLEEQKKKMRARIVVVAGHVHNYERYERGGVMYIVSGGGGATPYMIERHPDDAYKEPGATYHFCKFTVAPRDLKFQMIRYESPGQFAAKDEFELKEAR